MASQLASVGVVVVDPFGDVGGVGEAIENGVTGFLLEQDNLKQWVAVVTKLLKSEEERKKLRDKK